jgi:hypothetical protein
MTGKAPPPDFHRDFMESAGDMTIFHQLTGMCTTHGVGNSQSMGARAFELSLRRGGCCGVDRP